jgi:hypothetical protein
MAVTTKDDGSGPLSTAAHSLAPSYQANKAAILEERGVRMTDNSRKRRIIACLEQALTQAKELELDGDVVGLVDSGEALTVDMAAYVRQCCPEWIRQTCERLAETKHSIGTKIGRDWIIVTKRLLDLIGRTEGKDARGAAEARATKYGYKP